MGEQQETDWYGAGLREARAAAGRHTSSRGRRRLERRAAAASGAEESRRRRAGEILVNIRNVINTRIIFCLRSIGYSKTIIFRSSIRFPAEASNTSKLIFIHISGTTTAKYTKSCIGMDVIISGFIIC